MSVENIIHRNLSLFCHVWNTWNNVSYWYIRFSRLRRKQTTDRTRSFYLVSISVTPWISLENEKDFGKRRVKSRRERWKVHMCGELKKRKKIHWIDNTIACSVKNVTKHFRDNLFFLFTSDTLSQFDTVAAKRSREDILEHRSIDRDARLSHV